MKREGPCYHCGIAYTPLWRNGPNEKPVLCNACGSRWRIRGTLADYVPKHADKDNQVRKKSTEGEATKPNFSSVCFADEKTNKSRSSSTSSSDTCIHSEDTIGLDEFKIWDKESVPKRKRSVLSQYVLSPVERLHKDLLHIMYQQEDFLQPAEEDELVYTNTNLFSSFQETAYGSMLLQSPNPETRENKRWCLGTEKETKPKSPLDPLTEKETNAESPIKETDIKIESPCRQKKASGSTVISLEQLSPKSVPPTDHVAQRNKCSLCVRKRGRPRKGNKHIACHNCTSSRDSQDESGNGGKDGCIHPLAPSEVRVVSPTERNRGRQLQYSGTNKKEGNQLNSNIEGGGSIEEEAELVDIPLLSALNLGSEIVRQQYHSPGTKNKRMRAQK